MCVYTRTCVCVGVGGVKHNSLSKVFEVGGKDGLRRENYLTV